MGTLVSTAVGLSIYRNVGDIKSEETIPFDIFLDNIRDGRWQDIVLPIRVMEDKEREFAKKRVPCVTIAGSFNPGRKDDGIKQHSGFLAMDFDKLENVEEFKSSICCDPYLVAAFTSISGRGLCAIFRVDSSKHKEAFQGLSQYLFEKYGQPCDPTSINPSRTRFVSYDPDIYINPDKVDRFTMYPKEKPPKKIDKSIYAPDDFKMVLEQVVSRRLNLTESYHEWLRIGFGLVHQFSEEGRHYFHILSQYSSKYDSRQTDKQYDACLKHKGNSEATIAMFYYYAKQAGLEIYSERTKKIAWSAAQGKAAGLTASQVAENLEKFEDITGAEDIIKQVMDNNIILNEDTLLDQLELWMRQNYELRRNGITRYIECNNNIIQQKDFNTIFIKAKKFFEKLSYELMDRLINSDFVPTYNPLTDWFAENESIESTSHIAALFDTVNTPNKAFLHYFGTKWIVGMISAAHGEHSPLMLVFSGEKQGTGKTEFFRRLLPKELFGYYAESKLDAGKDDEILMTQKWLIVDDEMGGKSKKEAKRLKELTSKQWFSLREPYGRNNVDLLRLAVLAGTSNDNEILNDPTGNRRIIPVHVDGVDYSAYNEVNKSALFAEAYRLWKNGYEWRLTREDIELLASSTNHFEASCLEAELIQKYYELPEEGYAQEMTASEVKVELEGLTNQKLILDRIGKELKRLGYKQKIARASGSTRRVYLVTRSNNYNNKTTNA